MALTFIRHDVGAKCSSSDGNQCSGAATPNAAGTELLVVGGNGSGSNYNGQLAAEQTAFGSIATLIVPASTNWAAGDWTVRYNVSSANMNMTWVATYICRVSSTCVNQATIGSLTGQSISLGTTGVKSMTVSGSAQTPGATDKIVIMFVFTNGAMTAQSWGASAISANIDSPFTVVQVEQRLTQTRQAVKRASIW